MYNVSISTNKLSIGYGDKGVTGDGLRVTGYGLRVTGDGTEPVESQKPPKVLRDLRDLRVLKGGMAEAPAAPVSSSTAIAHARKVKFERTLDLRGMRVDEATEALIAYMDDALMVGAGEVTILHGTGTGALKQVTRDYLNGLNNARRKRGQVALEFGDGDVNHGGAGLTVVKM